MVKKLTAVRDSVDMDIQLLALEMDYSAKDLRCITNYAITDAIQLEQFNAFIKAVESGEIAQEAACLTDNLVMYEYEDEPIVINRNLGEVMIIFDNSLTSKIEQRINNYNS